MPESPDLSVKASAQYANINDLIKELNNLHVCVKVGFLSGRQHVPAMHKAKDGERKGQYANINGGAPNLQGIETCELARTLHYGGHGIPARPFLEQGLESAEDNIFEAFSKELAKELSTKNGNFEKVGTMAVGAIQEFVRSDYYKGAIPNSPKTIEYKGSDTPLIDGGDLINSLEFVVSREEEQ